MYTHVCIERHARLKILLVYAQLIPLYSDTVQHRPLLVVLVISHTLQNLLSVAATTRVCVLETAFH